MKLIRLTGVDWEAIWNALTVVASEYDAPEAETVLAKIGHLGLDAIRLGVTSTSVE